MSNKGEGYRLILCNDGGPLLGPTVEAPMGKEGLTNMVIDPLIGTGVDTLFWQLGTDPYRGTPAHRHSDIYSHRTNVAPRWGDDRDTFGTAADWRIYENTRQLIEEGTDPPQVVIEEGRKAGLKVFLSMRINDVHDGKLDGDAHISPTKKQHPNWLLGAVSDTLGENEIISTSDYMTLDMAGLSRFAYDFSNSDVRDYKIALAEETIANYDLDGLDWDFCRFPRLFPAGKAEKNTDVLTDMLRKVRQSLDEKSKLTGRKIHFSVRVPPTFELASAFGMDIKRWMDEKLIDILIAGVVQGSMFRVPVEQYVEAARDTDIRVIAQNLGLFWPGRPRSAKLIYREPEGFTTAMCRASASTYWQAGVDGLYLWNNQIIPFEIDPNYDRQAWKEIANHKTIANLNKHYLVDNKPHGEIFARELGSPTIPSSPLPVCLAGQGDLAEISIDIADDVSEAESTGSLLEATLRIMIVNLTAEDELNFKLNGEQLNRSAARTQLLYNDCWIEFDVSGSLLRQGWNRIQVVVLHRNPKIDARLTIESVETIIRYGT